MANDSYSFLVLKALGAHTQKGANLSWPLISKWFELVGPSIFPDILSDNLLWSLNEPMPGT